MALMPSNFHSIQEELYEFILRQEAEGMCRAYLFEQHPFRCMPVNSMGQGEFLGFCNDHDPVCQVSLILGKPELDVSNSTDFHHRNLEVALDIGRQTSDFLIESSIAYDDKTDNRNARAKAKAIFKDFKKTTWAGAWMVSPEYKVKGFYKNHRFTRGAMKLQKNGVTLLPITKGKKYYVLGKEEPAVQF